MPLYDQADHYKALFESAARERNQCKAWLFDAWLTIKGQAKGLKRQRRLIRRLQAAVATHSSQDVEVRRLRNWIKGAPHRMDCPARSLPDHYQGQQVPCTCGRNHMLGLE